MRYLLWFILFATLGTPLTATAQPSDAERQARLQEHFELHVRPLLVERCGDCHLGESVRESGLSIATREDLLRGGDFGRAILPGRAEDSLLIQAVRRTHKELRMPPEDEDRLSRDEIGVLVRWIDDGAVWGRETVGAPRGPTSDTAVMGSAGRQSGNVKSQHWAFLPRRVAPPPLVGDPRWATTPIDRFVEYRRQQRSLQAVAPADRTTLIRRVTFGLTGLPPSPEEVADFLDDPASDRQALARVVDRLLASQHYGEHQARQWLDVARYADTQGDVGDFPIPEAYRYRNWVIDAFNRDLPFDEFLEAQIAGDILALQTTDTELAKQQVVATGFIALSRRFGNTKQNDLHLTIEDTLDTLGRGVLGLTLRCARCHDHKFDPLRQADYYALYGMFDSTVYPWMGASDQKSPSDLSPAVPTVEARREADAFWALISRYEYQINNHHRPWLKPTLDEYREVTARLRELDTAASDSARETNAAESELAERSRLEERRDELLARHGGKFRELMLHDLNWIKREKQRLADNPPVEFVFAVLEGKPHDVRLHRRGDPKRPGQTVPRNVPAIVAGQQPFLIDEGSGRLELARWLTQPEHPLTARVFVNRVWQQHFGRGMVATADNFGRQGERPSHPNLLDWLAQRFIDQGWSVKQLHREILLTETYRLASDPMALDGELSAAHQISSAIDPDSVYLWKFSRRRLRAEEIRDAILAVSGQLDRSRGGRHPFKPWHAVRYSLNRPFREEFPTQRRSIYMMTQRLFRNSFLGLFDGPDRNSSTSRRTTGDVPAQALYLMNSDFMRDQSRALAERICDEHHDDQIRLQRLFQLACGREPGADERSQMLEFLRKYRDTLEEQDATADGAAYLALARAVLSSNEFFYID